MASQTVPAVSALPQRRIAVLDIETVSLDPTDPRGALDAMTGRVVAIGLLFDDGNRLSPEPICEPDEKKMLERFWAALGETDLFVGHGALEFDLPFLRQRSWILNVKPTRAVDLRKYYTTAVFDTLAMWTNWSPNKRGATLDNIAYVLGCGQKTAHGSDVAAWWANRDFPSIVRYCMDDVWLTYKIYCRMNYRDPLGFQLPVAPALLTNPEGRPIFEPQRELVPVRAHAQAAPIAAAAQAPLPEPVPAPVPRGRIEGTPRNGNREIVYRVAGNPAGSSIVLSGFTMTIKDTLKKIYGARGRKISEKPNRYEWEIAVDKWESLQGLCAKSGIQLVPAGSGRAA